MASTPTFKLRLQISKSQKSGWGRQGSIGPGLLKTKLFLLSPLLYLKVITDNLDNDKKICQYISTSSQIILIMIKDVLKSKSYNIFRFPLGDQSALSHSGEPLINQDHHKITIKHHTVPIKELKWCTLNTNSVSHTYIFKNRRLGTTIKPLCQETRGA